MIHTKKLKEGFESAVKGYTDALCEMWDSDADYNSWVADETGGIYDYNDGYLFLNLLDIIYIVDNGIDVLEVAAWQDYNVRAAQYGFNNINLKSWHEGCPRTPDEVFDKLDAMRKDLKESIDKYKEEYGNGTGDF